jgi:hypothetical protein
MNRMLIQFAGALAIIAGIVAHAATANASEARIRMQSCSQIAAVSAAGEAEDAILEREDRMVRCVSDLGTLQKINSHKYLVQVTCQDNSQYQERDIVSKYEVSVRQRGGLCEATNADVVND